MKQYNLLPLLHNSVHIILLEFAETYYVQGFVAAVNHMREFVPAIYDLTFAFPKDSPPPTMLRLLKGQPSVVSQL